MIFAENKKPNLFIVGAPRCGTTSMFSNLREHPDIFMSRIKEPHYFGSDLDVRGAFGDRFNLETYASHFSNWNDEKYAGEASPFYLYSKQAAAEIKAFNSAARIIIMLRNPVDFLYSYHHHVLNLGYENIIDFEAALEAEPARKQGRMIPPGARKYGEVALYYKDLATFSDQVQRYFETFGRESVHVVILDDLETDPVRTWGKILRFLGIDEDAGVGSRAEINPSRKVRSLVLLELLKAGVMRVRGNSLPARATRKLMLQPLVNWTVQMAEPRPPMPQPLRLRLQETFASEVERLGKILERDLHGWTQPPVEAGSSSS